MNNNIYATLLWNIFHSLSSFYNLNLCSDFAYLRVSALPEFYIFASFPAFTEPSYEHASTRCDDLQ